MSEQHLHLLALPAGGVIGVGPGNLAGEVTGPFVDIARDLAMGRVWATSLLYGTAVAMLLSRPIENCSSFVDPTRCL